MSKFSSAICSVFTGKEKPVDMKYVDISYEVNSTPDYDVAKEIRIGVKFETNIWITNLESTKMDDPVKEAIYKIKKAMVEELFGEFRPLIYDLYHALYQKDINNANNILKNLEKTMFDV